MDLITENNIERVFNCLYNLNLSPEITSIILNIELTQILEYIDEIEPNIEYILN